MNLNPNNSECLRCLQITKQPMINLQFTLKPLKGRPATILVPFALNEVLSGMAGDIIDREYPAHEITKVEII